MITRHVGANITIAGKDVTRDLSRYLVSVTYEDKLDGETDSVTLEFADVDKLFIDTWFPKRGDTLEVELWRENWRGDNQVDSLPLGTFEIDEVTNSFPPSKCQLKGNSCPQDSALRQTDMSAAWENVKLSKIARDIADAANVELFYEAADDPDIKRAEQSEMSRMSFLEKICHDYGLALKFADGKLVISDIEQLELQEPVAAFERSDIKRFSARATLTDVYKSAEVKYKHGADDELYGATVDDSTKSTGKTFKLNKRVNSKSEAERLAGKKLREKNRDEYAISMTVAGNFNLLSGNVIELKSVHL